MNRQRKSAIEGANENVGCDMVRMLKNKFQAKNNFALSKKIRCAQQTITTWESRGVSAKGLADIIFRLANNDDVAGETLLKALHCKYKTENLSILSQNIGVTPQTLKKYEDSRINVKNQ